MTFKPLRKRLEEVSKQASLRLDTIQQDILSWLLVGIFEHLILKSHLVFKGGHGSFENRIDLKLIRKNLPLKCAYKEVSFKDPADFFDEKMIRYVSKTWNQWLSPLVANLPDPHSVIEELKIKIPLCVP